jgi:hypothetical protein
VAIEKLDCPFLGSESEAIAKACFYVNDFIDININQALVGLDISYVARD